jgi:uncharacterized repeat protein (TIGR02543 family)
MTNDGTPTQVPWAVETASWGTAIGTVKFPANPTRENYAFAGWTNASGSSGTAFTATTEIYYNMEVYAQWTEVPANSYTVTFMVNDGTEAIYAARAVTQSTAIGWSNFPASPSRTGYTMSWNTWPSGTGTDFTATTTVNSDMTVYARWTATPYTIIYNVNGGDPISQGTYTVNDLPFALSTPTRSGYTFDGWYDYATGTMGTAIPTGSTGDKTFTAMWTPTPYTITYNLNGGNFSEYPAPFYTVESSFPISLATPTRSGGYDFGGWYDNEGLIGIAVTMISAGSTGDKDFYAKWTVNAGITLDPDAGDGAFDGTFDMSKSGTPNPTYRNIAIPTNMGYSNPRWFVDGTLVGTTTSITISAGNYGVGGHNLTLIVTKSGISWSKEITFTVTN